MNFALKYYSFFAFRIVVQKFPLLNNKFALMRAYKYTTMQEGDKDAWVEKTEFRSLLKNLFYFNKVC